MGKTRPKDLSFGKNPKSLLSLGPEISMIRTDGRTETGAYKRYHLWWVTLKNMLCRGGKEELKSNKFMSLTEICVVTPSEP